MDNQDKNALVINLTRFGDLIQSQPVLSGLKKLGFSTHLVCLENFASAARILNHADCIHPFPGSRFLALLDVSWTSAVREVQDWVNHTSHNHHFELAINLTPSLSSRLLIRHFQATENRGFFLDEMGFGCYSGNWAAFLQASSAHRGSSPFNIVDLFSRSAHMPGIETSLSVIKPDRKNISAMQDLLARESEDPASAGFISFQLGASADRRRWPVEYFASLGDSLFRQLNICPVLLGTENERKLARKYQALSAFPSINLTGRTNLSQLSAALTCSKLLVTNDTGTMHLAAGLGVKSLSFFLATAQPWDTGPYLENCLCLEPGLDCHPCSFSHECQTGFSCRRSITPDIVFKAIEGFIQNHSWPVIQCSETRVRLTAFRNDLYCLRPMNKAAMDNYSMWMLIQQHFYRLFLDEMDIVPPSGHILPDQSYCKKIREHIRTIAPLLNLAAEQANVLKKVAVPSVKKKFLSTWQRLNHELSKSPYLPVLGLMWTYQTQAASTDLHEIYNTCHRYSLLLNIINDFLSESARKE